MTDKQLGELQRSVESVKSLAFIEGLRSSGVAGGGMARIRAQHDKGKLTARERLALVHVVAIGQHG